MHFLDLAKHFDTIDQWYSTFFFSRHTIIHQKFTRNTHVFDNNKNFGYALR
jgi:hypothetical protein